MRLALPLVVLVTLSLACEPGEATQVRPPSTPSEQSVLSSAQELTAVAQMAVPRWQHTVTKLASGKVLVVGGNEFTAPSVELFDPVTSTWSTGAPLATNRRAHTATLLPDGSVLVVGGISASGVLASCERYSPASGTWAACAPLPRASYWHTATLLADGRVLVAGGVGYVSSTSFYTPATDQWTVGPALASGRMGHAAVRLNNGAVLITGGSTSTSTTTSAEILWPSATAWQSAGNMMFARTGHSMVVANGWKNGLVIIAGGMGNDTAGRFELYSVTNGFGMIMGSDRTLGSHSSGTLVALSDGTVILAGDAYGNLGVERLPSNSYVWEQSDTLSSSRDSVPMVELNDGKVLLPGGNQTVINGTNQRLASVLVTNGLPAAKYSATSKAMVCTAQQSLCAATTTGRATLGPEANAPLTLDACADGTSGVFHGDESLDGLRIRSVDGSSIAVGKPVIIEADVWAYAAYTSDQLDLFISTNATTPSWSLLATLTPVKAGASTLSATVTLPSTLTYNYALRGQFRWGGAATACNAGPYNDRDDVVFAVRWP